MSKTGDTKKKIIEILGERNVTLTDISNRLGLAPSTISQHLQELTDSGTIRLVEDRPRKWKYYELIRDNSRYEILNRPNVNRWIDPKRIAVPLAAIAIALVAAFLIFHGNPHVASSNMVYLAPGAAVPIGSTIFTVSDAPSFYNISSLVVTADSASIHSDTTGKWYNIPLQAKSFDLVQLKNISTILAGITLSNGIYDEVVLNISNVTATVNGTKESVVLPSGKLRMMVDFNITNDTTNWINIDFDLEHSLHVTGSGSIVMMPVVNLRHVSDNQLQLNQSSIIVANGPGMIKREFEEGMDQNGTMVSNYSVPQDINIVSSNGRINFYGSAKIPVIVRTRTGIIIGGDASSILNLTGGIGISGSNHSAGFQSKSLAGIAYNSCISQLPQNGSSFNISAKDDASLIRMCCALYAHPFENNSTAVIGSNVQVGTTSKVSVTGISSHPPVINCCYPTYISTSSGKVAVRRCWPIGIATNSTEGFSGNATVQDVVNAGSQHVEENISASALNHGLMSRGGSSGSSSELNISVNNSSNGAFSTQCSLQNGALSCGAGITGNISEIAIDVGHVHLNSTDSVSVTSTVEASSSTTLSSATTSTIGLPETGASSSSNVVAGINSITSNTGGVLNSTGTISANAVSMVNSSI
ncbi:MAG: DUF4382 domain-containing protein [Candidatus Micrarchaeota archaeon]|nr:DUF4382 domain-containing protein [Candidatus Micrarchaeota archaeon]